jgi:hypothetical protein
MSEMFDLPTAAENIAFWWTLDEDGFVAWAQEELEAAKLKPLKDDCLKAIWRDAYSSMKEWLVNSWDELPETFRKAMVLSHAAGLLRGIYAEIDESDWRR